MANGMDSGRVVITGMGAVNAIAGDPRRFAAALKAGTCGIGPVNRFDTTAFRTHNGAEIRDFHPRALLPPEFSLKRASRADAFALVAAFQALSQAGLYPVPESLRERTGTVIGGGAGGLPEAEAFFQDYLRRGGGRGRFSRLATVACAAHANAIATQFGLYGPKATIMTACSSGATAIGLGRDLIRTGAAEAMIVGGAEPLCRVTFASFNALQAVDPTYCRPFSGNRAGLTLGEGAGILILESLAGARARGAAILGEVLGYGVTCDSHHMTAPDTGASGAVRAIRAALADAGIPPDAVDYINAHGTATPPNDLMETRAIKAVFGPRAGRIPVSSTKSMHGHTLGASGALEAVVSVLAITEGFIPPTIHCETPDPECDLDYVTTGARPGAPGIVLSNSFAFGGNNTAVIFGRRRDEGRGRG
ncbi:MAG TPA: beta-ketoacyl-[acyl-carrier-protein] synthase family protein [Syntrophus sp. (in: bacteria)]|nr:beta-ketoacyl-[acyl-carrier-protein] synthase family protein [Syntrophus sp. (in: bacteria)]